MMIIGNIVNLNVIIVYLHFCWFVSEELCQLLGIKRLTIEPKPKKVPEITPKDKRKLLN